MRKMKKNCLILLPLLVFMACKKINMPEVVDVNLDEVATTLTTAVIQGTYEYNMPADVIVLIYGKSIDLTSSENVEMNVNGNSFNVTLTELDPNTKYYFKIRFIAPLSSFETEIDDFYTVETGGGDNDGDDNVGDDKPVDNISWDMAQEFVEMLSYLSGKTFRLPTEAEWEYAARGGSRANNYKYSGSNSVNNVAWYDDNSSAQTNPTGPVSGYNKVIRGGSFSYSDGYCRVTDRFSGMPSWSDVCYGFRIVMEN